MLVLDWRLAAQRGAPVKELTKGARGMVLWTNLGRVLPYHYFRAIILALFFGFELRPMIFCVRDAGKSVFLGTDRRSQL